MGMKEGDAIESRMVSRRIEGAQKKVEERNFEIRKNLLEYDEVMDEQRKRVYGYRQKILDGADCRQLILEMIDRQVDYHLGQFLARDYGPETFAEWARKQLSIDLDARDFRDMDFPTAEAYAKDTAERMAEGEVLGLIEENLPEEVDSREWNWAALAKTVNTRWQLGLRDHKLRQVGREQLAEVLLEKVVEVIQNTDLSDGARYLDADFGLQRACFWVRVKFGIELDLQEIRHLEPEPLKDLIRQKASAAYEAKEADFPVMAVLSEATARDAAGHKRYVREEVVKRVKERFGVELSVADLKAKQRHDIEALLREQSQRHAEEGRQVAAEVRKRVDELFGAEPAPQASRVSARHDGLLR